MDKNSVSFKIAVIKSLEHHIESYKTMIRMAKEKDSDFNIYYLQNSAKCGKKTATEMRKELVDSFDAYEPSDQILILKFLFGLSNVAA